MNNQYPKFTSLDETSPEIWRPRGWVGRVYKLFSNLQFTRKELHLSDDLCVIQTELKRGHIKVGGTIEPGRLSISFYETSDILRMSGKAANSEKMAVSYNGCRWDAASKSPATSILINFSGKLAEQIVSQEAHSYLMGADSNSLGDRLSLVSNITPAGGALKHAIQSSFNLIEEDPSLENMQDIALWFSEVVLSLASCLIDEITNSVSDVSKKGESNRYILAREIERLLWVGPKSEEFSSLTLDSVASRFRCSRRQVQAAILKHFGIGFIELKRSIRLHQVYDELNDKGAYSNISSIAVAHEFEHLGRFSGYYKEMFGSLPSKHLRKNISND
jgi:AraC-like DNA-binding protein